VGVQGSDLAAQTNENGLYKVWSYQIAPPHSHTPLEQLRAQPRGRKVNMDLLEVQVDITRLYPAPGAEVPA
jgi:hypothetical protein